MNCSTLSTTKKRLAAITLVGLALLLQGCAVQNFCFHNACKQLMPEMGIYRVRYRDLDGLQLTVDTQTAPGGFISICNCHDIEDATLIVRNLPPDCSQASDTAQILWPPNLDFVNIPVGGVTDPEGGTVGIRIDYFEADEAEFQFIGDPRPDVRTTGASTAEVRAQRDPDGNGRVYRIFFTASDDQGATCQGQERVCVPISEGGTCVDDDRSTDLSLSGSGAPEPVNQGDLLTYTININNSFDTLYGASNVTLTDILPPSVTFVSAEVDGNPQRCTEALGVVTCNAGNIAFHQSKTATIKVRPTSLAILINNASVRALEKEDDPNNNTLTLISSVNPPVQNADASVSIVAAPNPVTINNELKFTIVVQNLNPQTAASGVTMTGFNLQLVGEQLGVDTTQGSCSQSSGALTCNIGTLAGGASATVTIKAIPFNVGNYTETVTVTSTNDPNSANNTASVQVQVKPP